MLISENQNADIAPAYFLCVAYFLSLIECIQQYYLKMLAKFPIAKVGTVSEL